MLDRSEALQRAGRIFSGVEAGFFFAVIFRNISNYQIKKRMELMDKEKIRKKIHDRYGKLATQAGTTLCGRRTASGCCGLSAVSEESNALQLGYSNQDMASVPAGANLGLGCGNPQAIASLKPGETVLDLGSGAGFDCFLAAKQVGLSGKVIGVDMSPEMVAKARENAVKNGDESYKNVEFRLGEIEHLPVADESVDIIMSNCVINLSVDKEKTFSESFRVLQPGGRLAVSDVVAVDHIPAAVKKNLDAISSCVGGAETVERLQAMLQKAGFDRIRIKPAEESRHLIEQWMPGAGAASFLRSATIEAIKPVNNAAAQPAGQRTADKAIRSMVHKEFKSGLHCAEAVAKIVTELFAVRPDTTTVRCAAGFGGGIVGTTEETCGALTGGIVSLGALLGRYNTSDSLQNLGQIGKRFKESFAGKFGSTHCATLRKGFEEKNKPLGCVQLSAEAAVMLADLIYAFEQEKGMSVAAYSLEDRQKMPLGSCPFSAN
jgi:C_GCAxxG_C_C family probable redox protein